MKDKKDHCLGWIAKGDSDFLSAQMILDSDGPYDAVCFHAQQAVEKYLKAFLIYQDARFPYTHDLVELYSYCQSFEEGLPFPAEELAELNPYAVELRYDIEFWPDRKSAQSAVATAQKVQEWVKRVITYDD